MKLYQKRHNNGDPYMEPARYANMNFRAYYEITFTDKNGTITLKEILDIKDKLDKLKL